jgi:uncharacterized repeat protein (TIGR04138 family)
MEPNDAFAELAKEDARYSPEVYAFTLEALAYTLHHIGERRHISGRELLHGIRDYALDCWGLMARHVLNTWGIRGTADFGDVVFNLVNHGMLSKTDEDKKEDFRDVFLFEEAFDQAFRPELDERGHIRRNLPGGVEPEKLTWVPFFGDSGLN